jgi:hypothetical protein
VPAGGAAHGQDERQHTAVGAAEYVHLFDLGNTRTVIATGQLRRRFHQQYLAKNPNGYRCHSATGVPFPEGV